MVFVSSFFDGLGSAFHFSAIFLEFLLILGAKGMLLMAVCFSNSILSRSFLDNTPLTFFELGLPAINSRVVLQEQGHGLSDSYY